MKQCLPLPLLSVLPIPLFMTVLALCSASLFPPVRRRWSNPCELFLQFPWSLPSAYFPTSSTFLRSRRHVLAELRFRLCWLARKTSVLRPGGYPLPLPRPLFLVFPSVLKGSSSRLAHWTWSDSLFISANFFRVQEVIGPPPQQSCLTSIGDLFGSQWT